MLPGSSPSRPTSGDDIHTILTRFSSWAGKQSGNGGGKSLPRAGESMRDEVGEAGHRGAANEGPEPAVKEVREVAYNEAIRKFRSRQAGASPAKAAPAASVANSPATQSPAPAQPRLLLDPAPAPPRKAKPLKQGAPARMSAKQSTGSQVAVTQPIRSAARKASAATSTKKQAKSTQTPEFRKVLAKTLRKAQKVSPERTSRISIRFAPEEEKQLRQAAAAEGLSVSSWLRNRALAAPPLHTKAVMDDTGRTVGAAQFPVPVRGTEVAPAPRAKLSQLLRTCWPWGRHFSGEA